jgi:hypothetical protein
LTKARRRSSWPPEEPQPMLFFRRTFAGFLGYSDGAVLSEEPVATVRLDEPTTVTATYRSEINPKILSLIVGVLTAGILAYLGTGWDPKIYRRCDNGAIRSRSIGSQQNWNRFRFLVRGWSTPGDNRECPKERRSHVSRPPRATATRCHGVFWSPFACGK